MIAYAVNGVVVAVTLSQAPAPADLPEGAEAIPIADLSALPAPGWSHDAETGKFSPPLIAAVTDPTATAKAEILALEALQTPRRLREAALGTDGGWLADLDAKIAALRASL